MTSTFVLYFANYAVLSHNEQIPLRVGQWVLLYESCLVTFDNINGVSFRVKLKKRNLKHIEETDIDFEKKSIMHKTALSQRQQHSNWFSYRFDRLLDFVFPLVRWFRLKPWRLKWRPNHKFMLNVSMLFSRNLAKHLYLSCRLH